MVTENRFLMIPKPTLNLHVCNAHSADDTPIPLKYLNESSSEETVRKKIHFVKNTKSHRSLLFLFGRQSTYNINKLLPLYYKFYGSSSEISIPILNLHVCNTHFAADTPVPLKYLKYLHLRRLSEKKFISSKN
jgi:hypothetical protein